MMHSFSFKTFQNIKHKTFYGHSKTFDFLFYQQKYMSSYAEFEVPVIGEHLEVCANGDKSL